MMELSFANPAGFWALLGIPAILLIHLLQRQSRRVITSTLFLLEQLSPVSAEGRRLERLRSSFPLWLQLLAVLLLTWLLVQPRWPRKDSTQRIVVVLDSSVSMRVFREPMLAALGARLPALAKAANHTEWVLIESDPARSTIYSGGEVGALLATLAQWSPRLGEHDLAPALRTARTLLGGNGAALLVTDHQRPVPEGIQLLAVGAPQENSGFIGMSVEGDTWHALVKNHGASTQTRTWQMHGAGGVSQAATLTLEAGQMQSLRGGFPGGADRCELVLSGDGFELDDRLPIIRPQPKRLTVAMQNGSPLEPFQRRLVGSLANVIDVAEKADVHLAMVDPTAAGPLLPGIAFLQSSGGDTRGYMPGELIAERHALTADLGWQGLLCRDVPGVQAVESDDVLLWQGERPLIFIRSTAAARTLVVNFDLLRSNADRLPSFVVLLHRFIDTIRAGKVAPEQLNFETNQLLQVASDPAGPALKILPESARGVICAPEVPGFFRVAQGDKTLLTGAAHFADPREADFRQSASFDGLKPVIAKLLERSSQQDLLTPAWALLLGGVMLANWAFTGRGRG
ncbi:MAG TPA: VWA domain-containing protein [Chthoniobacteraceae bacterium]|jgi:hypothetical protein